LGFGFWFLGFGFWVLGFGFWVLGFGFWVLGFEFWGLGFRGLRLKRRLQVPCFWEWLKRYDVKGSGLRVKEFDCGIWVQCFGSGIQGLGWRVYCSGLRVQGLGSGAKCLRCRGQGLGLRLFSWLGSGFLDEHAKFDEGSPRVDATGRC